jgi:hypothetical protein
MDMLSFSGCAHGCSGKETEELTRMRFVIALLLSTYGGAA